MGELVVYWVRLSNVFKHLSPELAGAVSAIRIFGALRYMVRTVLHYPDVWTSAMQSIERGMKVGNNSGPLFMAKYEPLFEMTVAQARSALQVEGADDIDTSEPSRRWTET